MDDKQQQLYEEAAKHMRQEIQRLRKENEQLREQAQKISGHSEQPENFGFFHMTGKVS